MDKTYRLFVPKQAVGANLVYFDLFNAASSGYTVEVSSVKPVVSGAVAVTGTLGLDLFLTGTTAIGTGGTAATFNGTDPTACTISGINPKNVLPTSAVTARLTPSGGATAGRVLSFDSVFTEETSAATYTAKDLVSSGNVFVPSGSGIRVVQGADASVGNIGFVVSFGMRQKS
ncbi:hypothetical protein UFOVP1155_23 [uncultured Caudovirales phage]|uniref:Uncharacterized protein n=1 Tax=uncultured Caudovirales phage TaxID=2100421 RepID=A0A6J5R3G8_9CAUD|nr:hypothetical protein UFOVP1155_23 [uncultured Caudovirales phage]